jgi:hypothetical protein
MGNWCNVRLKIVGRRSDVLDFSRLARARASSFFEPDMLQGEGQDLFSERAVRFRADYMQKVYKFQVCNDDGLSHFRRLSRRYPALCFVLVYGDPNEDRYGSYFIQRGRVRVHSLSYRQKKAMWTKHGANDNGDFAEEYSFWDASWELMDLAEAHWEKAILELIGH